MTAQPGLDPGPELRRGLVFLMDTKLSACRVPALNKKIKRGTRVKIKFREKREGKISDFYLCLMKIESAFQPNRGEANNAHIG
jgi:hypothetical protein